MKQVLALDTGTNTGWAFRIGSTIHSGTQNFQHDAKRESPGMRFARFAKWLRTMIEENDIKCVIYEQPHQRGGAATMVGVGLVAHLQSVCADLEVEHLSVHSGTLKRWATGKGNAGKDEMVAEAVKRAGRKFDSDDEADAYLMFLYGESEI